MGGTAAAQPGPFQAYLLTRTLSQGWRRTLSAALAPLISDGPIIILVVLVLAQTPAWFLVLMQIAGGLFLLYLARGAFQTFRSASADADNVPPADTPSQRSLLEAALVNLLAPGPYLFWATVGGPILVSSWRLSPILGISFIGGFYSMLIGGFLGFITLFAMAKRLDPQVIRGLSAVSVLLLFLLGLYQLWLGGMAIMSGTWLAAD